jgi:ABC-type lipoprotein export system ATPase subunit
VENKEAKYIDKVEIKGLFGRYDVDWQLNPDVNILVGENGTGKSTILDTLFMLTKGDHSRIPTSQNVVQTQFLDEFNRFIYCKLITNDKKEIIGNVIDVENKKRVTIERHGLDYFGDLVQFVNTFDDVRTLEKDNQRTYSQPKDYLLISNLDKELDYKITNYVDYQLTINKKFRNGHKDSEIILSKLNLFFEIVNRLFLNSGKSIDENENRIVFKFDDGTKILPYQLSSGEKQLLVILLTVLCQDEKPSILLMDEPEISLHISWQYELIEIIRTINPNCQVIIVTHSPSIFNDGLRDKVFWIEDIIKKIKHND